jgi:hypothetical protein
MILVAASGGQLGALVIAGALLIMAMGLAAIGLWSLRWPKVTGVIKVSIYDQEWQMESRGSTTSIRKQDVHHFAYSFEVHGQEYLSSAIRPNGDPEWHATTPGLSSAADRSRWYREGKVVDVYYCPLWPKWSCLEPGGFFMPVVVLAAAVGMFVIARFQ